MLAPDPHPGNPMLSQMVRYYERRAIMLSAAKATGMTTILRPYVPYREHYLDTDTGHHASYAGANCVTAALGAFLQRWKCVVVGGYAQSLYTGSQYRDIDIFFYNDADEAYIMSAAEDFYSMLAPEDRNISSARTKAYLSLVTELSGYEEYQFVFRKFSSRAEILYAMDISACQILWDGVQFMMTPLAQYTFDTYLIPVDLTDRGPYKGARLCKYMWRGYGIVLPGCDVHSVMGNKVQLFNIDVRRVRGDKVIEAHISTGKCICEASERHSRPTDELFDYYYDTYEVDSQADVDAHNIGQISQQGDGLIVYHPLTTPALMRDRTVSNPYDPVAQPAEHLAYQLNPITIGYFTANRYITTPYEPDDVYGKPACPCYYYLDEENDPEI
jgi:hypothetical protein